MKTDILGATTSESIEMITRTIRSSSRVNPRISLHIARSGARGEYLVLLILLTGSLLFLMEFPAYYIVRCPFLFVGAGADDIKCAFIFAG